MTRDSGSALCLRPVYGAQPEGAQSGGVSRIAIISYHPGDRCPGCSHRNWHIGRIMAECAFCETALPLAEAA